MKRIPYFDGHCDTVSRCLETGEHFTGNKGHIDLVYRDAFSAYGQVFALFADCGGAEACVPTAQRLYDTFCAELHRHRESVVQCRSAAEISAAAEDGRVAAVLSVEGAELLNCDPDQIALAGDWGVRLVNLTWNHANALCGSHCDRADRGLTDRGRAFVRSAEQADILIDVSHLSEKGFWDLMKITRRPVVASHSNSAAVYSHSRGLSDKQFRAVAETGGVVGLNLYSAFVGRPADMDALIAHLEHFLELGGEKAIAIGADFDGCSETAAGICGLRDIPRLYFALEARGWGERLLTDLFWNNWLRLL